MHKCPINPDHPLISEGFKCEACQEVARQEQGARLARMSPAYIAARAIGQQLDYIKRWLNNHN